MVSKHEIMKRRKLGKKWELAFCSLASEFGKSFTPMQIGRKDSIAAFLGTKKYTLPDVTVWTAPGEHHEIKHKNPTSWMMYGLEVYRFKALLWFARETKQDVMYTIHDWDAAGGRDAPNNIEHWFTANVLHLNENWVETNSDWGSIVNGKWHNNVPIHFWSVDSWCSLSDYWAGEDF